MKWLRIIIEPYSSLLFVNLGVLVLNIDIVMSRDVTPIFKLYDMHSDERFVYVGDKYLYNVFKSMDICKIFQAKINNETIGCIYTLEYMYSCGWIGGLLVHRRFRHQGIGRELVERAINSLKTPYTYLFVEPENTIGLRLFRKLDFKPIYRRLIYTIHPTILQCKFKQFKVTYDVEFEELVRALGFKERKGIVNLGYYPIKINEKVFNDLRDRGKVMKYGSIIVIIEKSHSIDVNGYEFIFNKYILEKVKHPPYKVQGKVVEVNPFYIKQNATDLLELLSYLLREADKIMLWTWGDDLVTHSMPFKEVLGALVMELAI